MADRVIWTESASQDLIEIVAYIDREPPFYSAMVAAKIVERVETLLEHARHGRIVPELRRQDTREVFVFSYRIIYRTEPDGVKIMSVIHGSRPLRPGDHSVTE